MHSNAERVKIWRFTSSQSGSSKVPTDTARALGTRSNVKPILVPQRGQNSRRSQRPLSSDRC